MAFSQGRNEIQSSIEDSASVLFILSEEINSFYSNKINAINDEIRNLQYNNTKLEIEELNSLLFPYNQLKDMYNSLYIESMEMIVSKVYSYAEIHFYMLINRINYKRKRVARIYKQDNPGKQGSDIEKAFYVIKKNYCLEKQRLSCYWNDFELIHKLRTNIVHHNNYKKQLINIEFIKDNINQVRNLLNTIEKITNNTVSE